MVNFYQLLERKTPQRLKQIIPERSRIWLGYQIKSRFSPPEPLHIDLAHHPLALPPGETEASVRHYLASYWMEDGSGKDELPIYLEEAFSRFLYTLELVPDDTGRLLEIGASPYLMTRLLRKFGRYKLSMVNYFGEGYEQATREAMVSDNDRMVMEFTSANIERDTLPFEDESFDIVLLCEVLEHFTNDPLRALRQLHRVLKTGGHLVLTTPNVARLVNVARLINGRNPYDPYSGFGPYGRHNREYTRQEVIQLLEYLGFQIEQIFTSDVHANDAHLYGDPAGFVHLVEHRRDDLGQYIFVAATKTKATPAPKRPRWLYRSYPAEELDAPQDDALTETAP